MAAADTTPPILKSLIFADHLDETGSNATPRLDFTAIATDAGLGVDHVTVTLDRPTSYGGPFDTIVIGSSDEFFQGQGSGSAYFDPSFSSRSYGIEQVAVYDRAGNATLYTPTQLDALGIATSIAVTSPAPTDQTPPTLASLSLPGTVDVTGGAASFDIGAGTGDDPSGIYGVELSFDHGLGSRTIYADRTSGDIGGSLYLSATAVSGSYHVTTATVFDRAGNAATYDAGELTALGIRTSFDVRSAVPADAIAPELTAITLPTMIDVTAGRAIAPISLQINEAGSGVADIRVELDRPIELDYPYQYVAHGGRYGGPVLASAIDAAPDTQGSYGSSLSFHQEGNSYAIEYLGGYTLAGVPVSSQTSAGTRNVLGVTITDNAGNSSHYSADQLHAMGASTSITIVDNSIPPTITGLTLPGTVPAGQSDLVFSLSVAGGRGSELAEINLDRAIAPYYNGGFPANDVAIGFATAAESGTRNLARTADLGTGVFTIQDLILTDVDGNRFFYGADQLRALGFATSFSLGGHVTDFDGNAFSDILWRNANGALSTWSASGGGARDVITQDTSDATASTSWHVVDTFDFTGDGRSDIVWRNDNGALSIWNGATGGFQQSVYNDRSVPTSWTIAGAADLDGDGKGDLLWRNVDGSVSSWLSTGAGFQKNAYFHSPVSTGWKIEGLGDFNGDGKADILWRNDNGALSTWNSTGTSFQESSTYHDPVSRSWHVVGLGDFNGDGRSDILWRNDNGAISVWQSNGANFDENRMNASAATSWSVAGVGDFSGDGRSDIVWRNSSGAISIWHSTGSGWDQNTYYDASVGHDWTITGHSFVL